MSEPEGNIQQSQNFAEVQFVTQDGSQIMEPLKIFQAVGAPYQVATPVLNGYVLIERPDELTRTMTPEPAYIKLVYAQIGTLQVYHGLTDVTGEAIPLQNGQTADNVAPIKLQSIPGQSYYVMNDEGLGDVVSDPDHYQPQNPAGKTNLISITEDERQHMNDLEQNLTIEANENPVVQPQPSFTQPQPTAIQPEPQPQPVQPQPVPAQPSIQQTAATQPQPAPVVQPAQPQPAATQPAQPQPAATQPTQPAQPQPAAVQPQPATVQPEPQPVQPQPATVQPEPQPVQPQPATVQPEPQPAQPQPAQPVQPVGQETVMQSASPEVGSRQAQWSDNNGSTETPSQPRVHTGAVDVISQALLMVTQALEQTAPQDKETRRELIESATRLVKAIGTLTRIDN